MSISKILSSFIGTAWGELLCVSACTRFMGDLTEEMPHSLWCIDLVLIKSNVEIFQLSICDFLPAELFQLLTIHQLIRLWCLCWLEWSWIWFHSWSLWLNWLCWSRLDWFSVWLNWSWCWFWSWFEWSIVIDSWFWLCWGNLTELRLWLSWSAWSLSLIWIKWVKSTNTISQRLDRIVQCTLNVISALCKSVLQSWESLSQVAQSLTQSWLGLSL